MFEYRILNGIMAGSGFRGTFETDEEAKSWWTLYAADHAEERARGLLVLERQEDSGEWADVPTTGLHLPGES